MGTDTSERGLERLICTALAGHPCDPPATGTIGEPSAGYGGVGWSGGNFPRLRPRVLRRSSPARGLPERHPARSSRIPAALRGQSDAAQVPGPDAGGNIQARHHRRSAPRHQAWGSSSGVVLRYAFGRKRESQGTLRSSTASPSPDSFATAATRHNARWTSGSS